MLLAVDAGNTETVLGLFSTEKLVDHWRIASRAERTSDEHGLLVSQFLAQRGATFSDVSGMVVSSTVPRLAGTFRDVAARYLSVEPVVVEPGTRTGMPILYDNPKEVGADRIANAVAAFDRYGGPTIVVDFGTATTVDATSAAGEYLGGAILPGIEISLDALFSRAAALSKVRMSAPKRVIGKSTVESVQSGTFLGFASAVDGLCARFQAELGPCHVISTGGLGHFMSPLSEAIQHYEPSLTLEGLRLIFERNR